MNNKRRAAIRKIIDQLNKLSAELEELKNEEEEYFENMPEPLQDSERGDIAQDNIAQLQEAVDELESAISSAQRGTDCGDNKEQEQKHLTDAFCQLEVAIICAKESID